MSESKICPNCGTPRQWEKWRHCFCGYDFDPGYQPPPVQVSARAEIEEASFTYAKFRRGGGYLSAAAAIIFIITLPFDIFRWLNHAAGVVCISVISVVHWGLFRKR